MNLLALDTTGPVASVAVLRAGKLVYEAYLNNGMTHSQFFMPLVDEALEHGGLSMKEIDAVACAIGPGSFTGVRIGVATARGLAHAWNIQTVGVNTLDALAWNAAAYPGTVCPMLDARRQEVYTACFQWEGERFKRLSEYQAISVEEAVKEAGEALYLGDGAKANREAIEGLCGAAHFIPEQLNLQRASGVAMAGQALLAEGKGGDYHSLIPYYIRRPQAEREYLKKQEMMKQNGNKL